jgi:hypothetical protein
MTNCDERREENTKLTGVSCCRECHIVPDSRRPANWVCCRIDYQETLYRPTSRADNPLRS